MDGRRRRVLLEVARAAVTAAAKDLPYAPTCEDAVLQRPGAAFVTLRKHGELRGCIGTVTPRQPLVQTVARMARAAAREDSRFQPVDPWEVSELKIEISLLGPPRRVTNVSEIEVGTHGVIVQQGPRSGLLLPQVAVEWGWTREDLLDQACLKAGLPRGAWRRGLAISAFTAEVFGEEG